MWGDGKGFYCPMIRFRSFSELLPLYCEIHKCVSVSGLVRFGFVPL